MNNRERGFYKETIKKDILVSKMSIEHFLSEEKRYLTELELDNGNKFHYYESSRKISMLESKKAIDSLREVLYNVDEALIYLERIREE